MMPRIYIRDQNDEVLDTLDEGQYFDDNMQRFLKGKATVLSFTIVKDEASYALMTAGRNLSFRYDEEDFWLSCVIVEQDETYLTVTAWSLGLELNNETHGPYKAPKAMTFAEYLAVIDIERILTIGINEVSDKKISHEWEGTESKLARLYSLATVFSAELAFDTELNEDGSLKQISLNVYREHSDADQGLGQDRRNETFYFGEDIKTIRKTEDTSDLYTAIFATGKDGLTIAGIEKEVFDEDGNLLFATYKTQKPGFGDPRKLYAPQARDQFPSNTTGGDRWTLNTAGEFEYESAEALLGYMMSELKKNCQPATTWEIEGYIKAKIGDTVRIADEGYKPTLFLEARVIEQEISFSDKTKNKSTFSNVVELESQVDSSLLDRVQKLIEANKTYQYSISTDNGIVFKNNTGTTTLTANVRDGVADVTGSFGITWFKDGVSVGTGVSLTVRATDVAEKAVYRFEASRDGNVVGGYEVTVSDVTDGEEGFSPIVTPNDNGTITIVDKEGEKTTPDLTGPQGPPGEVDQELIDEITNTAEDAKKAGEAAQAAAEQAEADSALAVENANNAVNKANEASAKADQSQQTADQAKSDAANAAGKAQSAFDSATTALEGVEGVKTDLTTEVTRIDGQLSTKVETTVFNSLKGTVNSQGTQITQNTNDIKLKANQTDVDTIAGRVTSAESQLTVQAGKIAGLTSLTDGHTSKIGALELQAGQFSLSLSNVQNDLNGLEIGGRNYAKNSDRKLELSNVTNNRNQLNGDVPYNLADLAGKVVTISAEIEVKNAQPQTSGGSFRIGCEGNMPRTSGGAFYLGIWENLTTGQTIATKRISRTLTVPADIIASQSSGLHLYVQANGDYFRITKIKLGIGTKALDWSLAPEDQATVTSLTEVKATVDSLTMTVADKEDKTTVTQLANQWQQTTDLANGHTSQISSLGDAINLRVTQDQVDASILADKTILDTRDDNQPPSWYYANYPKRNVSELKRTSTIGLNDGSYAQLTSEVTWIDKSVPIKQTARTNSKTSQRFSTSETTWSAWSTIADSSNVVSQINVSSEGVLIAGDKIQILGNTYIESGVIKTAHIADAAITNAKIGSLSADKVTVGTLNGANVNIINLDAKNILADTFTGLTFRGVEFIGSQFINDYTSTDPVTGVSTTGQLDISGGGYLNQYTNNDGTGGMFYIDQFGRLFNSRNTYGVQEDYELNPGGLALHFGDYFGTLTAQMLSYTTWIEIPLKSGFQTAENNPPSYRVQYNVDGTRTVKFRGQVTTTNAALPNAYFTKNIDYYWGQMPADLLPEKNSFFWGCTGKTNLFGGRLVLSLAHEGQLIFNSPHANVNYVSLDGWEYTLEN